MLKNSKNANVADLRNAYRTNVGSYSLNRCFIDSLGWLRWKFIENSIKKGRPPTGNGIKIQKLKFSK